MAFQFKEFYIQQENTAQKLSTDACLLGALANHPDPLNILDIGTGCGILALMLAQKYPIAQIHAIEPHTGSFLDAKANFEASKWKERLYLFPTPMLPFLYHNNLTFDLIICNPPYFKNDLLSVNKDKNQARHQLNLNEIDLFTSLSQLLSPAGVAWLMAPLHIYKKWPSLAQTHQLYEKDHIEVYTKPDKSVHVVISSWSFEKQSFLHTRDLLLVNENGEIPEFVKQILAPYYLYW